MDDPADSKALAEKLKLGFPLVSDPKRELVKAWGLFDPGNDIAWPAVYVIRADGTVAWRRFLEGYKTRPPPKEILAAVDAAAKK